MSYTSQTVYGLLVYSPPTSCRAATSLPALLWIEKCVLQQHLFPGSCSPKLLANTISKYSKLTADVENSPLNLRSWTSASCPKADVAVSLVNIGRDSTSTGPVCRPHPDVSFSFRTDAEAGLPMSPYCDRVGRKRCGNGNGTGSGWGTTHLCRTHRTPAYIASHCSADDIASMFLCKQTSSNSAAATTMALLGTPQHRYIT